MKIRQLNKMVKIVTVCATCLLVVLVCVIIGQYIKLGKLNNQNDQLNAELANMQAYRQQLEAGIATRKSSTYLELQAREQLGMIKEGETIYIYQ